MPSAIDAILVAMVFTLLFLCLSAVGLFIASRLKRCPECRSRLSEPIKWIDETQFRVCMNYNCVYTEESGRRKETRFNL